ncbi:11767_t:CDS:2 [Dentiscutata erythropus]|uniref:11767_t:CDS:1 n=1 Tax=Dentiscutata erythropus TaxID=1348616 RepID=A0A9N9HGA1_9GLOM|nr:11767_t:CDS:2 [Dentiscutata erythropus]
MDLSEFQCTICRELKPNPRETQCCPRFYCQECIQNIGNICPICKESTSFKECPQVSRLINAKLGEDFEGEVVFTNLLYRIYNYIFRRNEPNTTSDNLPNDNLPHDYSNAGVFKIKIMNLQDIKFDIYVEESDTVEILKLKVHQKDGTRPEHQRLIFRGKQLENHNTISFYKIKKDCTIHLVGRYNGS